jgi:ActR/RegA family two-component response regulator
MARVSASSSLRWMGAYAASRATVPTTGKRAVPSSHTAAAHAPPHNDAAPVVHYVSPAPWLLSESRSSAYIQNMGLNCLLLTSDATLLKVIQSSFSAATVGLELRTDAASAIELSARRRLDGFVIDCDDVFGAIGVLAKIRSSRSNKQSVVFAVVNGTTTVSTAVEVGANFVLGKPVQVRHLGSILDIALPRMEREHRRYFRHRVDLPIKLVCDTGETLAGKIINVSEGGLALVHFVPAPIEGVVTVQFGLPSAHPQSFQARAQVVWNDAYAMGLRFLNVEPSCRSWFEAWLDSLAAQLQFRVDRQHR